MFIITLICGALLMYSFYNRVRIQEVLRKEEMIFNLNSGINLLLDNSGFIGLNERKKISLYGEGNDSVELFRQNWGVFEKISAKVNWNRLQYKKIALTGNYVPAQDGVSLYLTEQNKPLAVCGNTKIKGKLFLPKLGIKSTFIEGKSYTGEKLVFSSITQSSAKLPLENKMLTTISFQYLRKSFTDPLNNSIEPYGKRSGDTLDISFEEITKVLFDRKNITLTHWVYAGNMVIISDSLIEVSRDCKLENVILLAPCIKIESGFTGILQAFASDSIMVGKNCKLNYPSVLAISNEMQNNINPCIFLGDRTMISGIVINYLAKTNNKMESYINIGKNTVITGQVYCNGPVEHKGIVNGSIYCNKFVLQTPTSFYENNLLDAVIDIGQIPVSFIGINLISQTPKKGIVRWLY